jgi:hypothetical protein
VPKGSQFWVGYDGRKVDILLSLVLEKYFFILIPALKLCGVEVCFMFHVSET